MARPILPSPDALAGAFQDGLVAARPSAYRHINTGAGRWGDVKAAIRAQAAVAIARLADEVAQRRLPFASGDGLIDLVASEFLRAPIDRAPTKARGAATFHRATTVTSGVIPAGTRIVQRANPSSYAIPLNSAEWETAEPVPVPAGTANVTVRLVATREGAHANVVREADAGLAVPIVDSSLFDTFTLTVFDAAGGSGGVDDATLAAIASAFAFGQFGPTEDALIAGCLIGTGARYAYVCPNLETGVSRLFVADASWGCSQAFRDAVKQRVVNGYAGFGPAIDTGDVQNEFVRAEATIVLREARLLADTSAISENVRASLRSYFDDRPDWWTWSLAGVRAAVVQADRRIQTCSSAAVKTMAGVALPEPATSLVGESVAYHMMLVADAATLTFQAP